MIQRYSFRNEKRNDPLSRLREGIFHGGLNPAQLTIRCNSDDPERSPPHVILTTPNEVPPHVILTTPNESPPYVILTTLNEVRGRKNP